MFKVIVVVVVLFLLGAGYWAFTPRIANSSPQYQTDLSYRQFDTRQIEQLWPAPKPGERVRARIILQGEEVIFEDGPTDMIINTHSMRKSFLSLLYGIAVEQGLIDLDKTLAELGIDETTPLTDQEKTATIRDLLMFRSGIYLPAEGEHDSQITDRPARGSHAPGEFFFSNNFDANALGTIFVQETGYQIGAFMEEFLAGPLGMQDFTADNVIIGDPWFWPTNGSMHPMYYMYMSARDTARIGAMVAQGGRWNEVQVVPAAWIALSTAPLSDLSVGPVAYTRYDGFGYIWWVSQKTGTVWTDGYGGQFMLIDPGRDLVLVERNFTGNSYFSTLRWMLMGDNKFSQSLGGLIKTHEMLARMIDEKQ